MKSYEKIVLIIFALGFALQLFDFPGNDILFLGSAFLLSMSYLIGGYVLFNGVKHDFPFLYVISGIALSISIFFMPFLVWLKRDGFYDFVPVPSGLLLIGLGIYFFRKESKNQDLKLILLRSFVVLFITSFFTYLPPTFKIYRKITYALNVGHPYIQTNLKMFDYASKYEVALKKGACNEAIKYAQKANEKGKLWLEISDTFLSNEEISNKILNRLDEINNQSDFFDDELEKISGTYTNLYEAFRCKGDAAYNNREFEEALINYNIAHYYLTISNQNSAYWNEEKSWSFNDIAFSLTHLKKYDMANTAFVRAIENYKIVKDTNDLGMAKLLKNFASFLSDQEEIEESIHLYHASNKILLVDSLHVDNKKDLISNYNSITENYLKLDNLDKAQLFNENAFHLLEDKQNADYCHATLYSGIYFFKRHAYEKAKNILRECSQCYENSLGSDAQNVAETNLILSRLSMVLAEYDNARNYVEKGMDITKKNYGSNSSRYAGFLKTLAELDEITGVYQAARKYYQKSQDIYNNELGAENDKLPVVLSGLANLEVILSNLTKAKEYSDHSLAIASLHYGLSSQSILDIINTAAFVDYNLGSYKSADSLYRRIIEINTNNGFDTNTYIAAALNGLALIETDKKNYIKAETLFLESLDLYETILSDNHPATAIVNLNYANLLVEQNNLSEAEEKLKKVRNIFNDYFEATHDVFGDLFVVFGDLNKKQNELQSARNYYKKAFEIYLEKFDENHRKVISTREKTDVLLKK